MRWRDIPTSLEQVTAPAFPPITRAEAKLHLKVDDVASDPLIDSLVLAARQTLEDDTNLSLVPTLWDLWVDRFPDERVLELPRGRVVSVPSLTAYAEPDVGTVFDASQYRLDPHRGRVALREGASWPTSLRAQNGGVIRFTAGYQGLAVPISMLTASGVTAAATTALAHGFTTGQRVTIAGAAQGAYNGTVEITVTGDLTFTFPVTGSPESPATGTITATPFGIPERLLAALKVQLWLLYYQNLDPAVREAFARGYEVLVNVPERIWRLA